MARLIDGRRSKKEGNPTFCGRRLSESEGSALVVTYKGELLDPRYDLRNHSPTGFEIGYQGSGPAQLALAILTAVLGDRKGERYYQEFKRQIIAGFPEGGGFELTRDEVLKWFATYQADTMTANITQELLFKKGKDNGG